MPKVAVSLPPCGYRNRDTALARERYVLSYFPMCGLCASGAAKELFMQTLRETIAAVGALAAFLAKPAFGKRRASAIVQLEQASGGRLGVFALDLETGRSFAHRPGERFKLMSTFKAVLTAMVLKEASARGSTTTRDLC